MKLKMTLLIKENCVCLMKTSKMKLKMTLLIKEKLCLPCEND